MIRLGVLGHPVAHSRSPELHAQFARQVGLEIDYQKLDVAPGHFASRGHKASSREMGWLQRHGAFQA